MVVAVVDLVEGRLAVVELLAGLAVQQRVLVAELRYLERLVVAAAQLLEVGLLPTMSRRYW